MTTALTEAPTDEVALSVENLNVSFQTSQRTVQVVSDLNLSLRRNRITGLVGESGSGKSVTALALMDLLPKEARITIDRMNVDGNEINEINSHTIGSRRGRELSMIFQEPIRSLNPAFRAGEQIAAVARRNGGLSRSAAKARVLELLRLVGIPDPQRTAQSYPHQLSGGMSQRVMIAMALAGEPAVLFADEPTTALDVTTQAQVLELIRELAAKLGMTTLIATHDLGVIAELCDDVVVMYAGQIVEIAPVEELFARPQHPYTKALLDCSRLSDSALRGIPGTVPQPGNWPQGCRFAPRCELARDGICTSQPIQLATVSPAHSARCVNVEGYKS